MFTNSGDPSIQRLHVFQCRLGFLSLVNWTELHIAHYLKVHTASNTWLVRTSICRLFSILDTAALGFSAIVTPELLKLPVSMKLFVCPTSYPLSSSSICLRLHGIWVFSEVELFESGGQYLI